MNKEELRDFCIEYNLPFTIEFKEPWNPKPIEISPSDLNDTKKLIQKELDGIIAMENIFLMVKKVHTTS